jgi:hypothetical protein
VTVTFYNCMRVLLPHAYEVSANVKSDCHLFAEEVGSS